MARTLKLKRDTLVELTAIELEEVAGAAYTYRTACQATGLCDVTYGCFTHTTSLDCEPTDLCPETLGKPCG